MLKHGLSLLLAVAFSTNAFAQCQKIPDLINSVRPNPVEVNFTREFMPIPFREVASKADLVIEGTVQPVKTYLTEDECYLYTDYSVSTTALISGTLPPTGTPGPQPILFRTIGGTTVIDGVQVIVRDEQLPAFGSGQHVVLFLTRATQGNAYELVGKILGAFEVTPAHSIKSLIREKGAFEEVRGLSRDDFIREVQLARNQ